MSRTVFITGADSGIGQSIARRFALEKDNLIMTARNAERLHTVAQALSPLTSVQSIPMDLNDLNAIEEVKKRFESRASVIDVLIHTAGIYHDGTRALANINYENFTHQQIMETQNVGVQSFALLCHDLIPYINHGGSIITISGTFDNAQGWLPYYLSKKSLEHFTIGLSHELARKRVTANCVSPADTLTESYKKFFPEDAQPEKCLKPDDVADLVHFLSSHRARSITGQIIELRKNPALVECQNGVL